MKVLLLDDERLAIVQLEKFLGEYPELEIVGAFQDVHAALETIRTLKPDVVFLDIHMPELSGIQAALLIQEITPDVEVIFVTAYDEYAVQAFDMNAMDYILKPLSRVRLNKTIERLLGTRKEQAVLAEAGSDQAIGINCFQSLRFQYKDGSEQLPKWRTTKAQEVFAYLLHNRGDLVRKSTLLDLMWPDLDKKRAMTQLYTTIYLIRQCLQKAGIDATIRNLSVQEGYVLDASRIVIETEKWERAIAQLDDGVENHHEQLSHILLGYAGDYLQDYDYLWAENERERLRQIWINHARLLADYYVAKTTQTEDGIRWLERLIERDPYQEEETLYLMKLYDQSGHYDKIKAQYSRLEQMFKQDLGIGLSEGTRTWFENWQSERLSTH